MSFSSVGGDGLWKLAEHAGWITWRLAKALELMLAGVRDELA